MASCPKCGQTKLRKRKRDNLRHCRRCGVLRCAGGLLRNGSAPEQQKEPT